MGIEVLFEQSPRGEDGEFTAFLKNKRSRSARISYLTAHRTLLLSSMPQLFSLSLSISLLHHTYTPLCLSLSLSVYSLFFHLSRVLSPSFSFLGLRQKELSLLRCFSPIYVEYIYIHTYIYIYTLRRASPLNAVVPLTYSYILYTLLYTRNRALSIYLSICLSIYMYTLHIYIYIYISILYIQCCHNDMCIYVYVRTCTTYTIYTCIFLYVWHCRT